MNRMFHGNSRIGLPSNPSSRKNSIFDLAQKQLPVGLGNNATSPPSDDEEKRFAPKWRGSGTNLPPQTVKQALSMLKQASSATNVSQGVQERQYYRGLQQPEIPHNMRKGSIFNLGTNENQPRKDSLFILNPNESPGSRQRKPSIYVGARTATITHDSPNPIRKNSVMNLSATTESPNATRKPIYHASAKNLSSLSDSSGSLSTTSNIITGMSTDYGLQLGPGQIHPKGYRLTSARHGELKMGFVKIKGTVEVEVVCARNIVAVDCETPPDTYVKCYIKDGDRLRHKKKTRVVRHAAEPIYKQTIKYQSSDVFGRNIVIMLWQRCVGFEHNQGLGGTEVNLDKVNIAQHIGGWYPLFPMHSYGGSDSDNSP